MSAQHPSSGPLVEGPHDPEHDPTASYALDRSYVAALTGRVVATSGRTAEVRSPLSGQPLAHIPQSTRGRRRRGVPPGARGPGAVGAHADRRPRRGSAAAARPRPRPPGGDHRPDLLGVRQGPQARLRRAAAHRADRPLLRAYGAPAPRHPRGSAASSRCSPGSRSTGCPRASSGSSRPGTTRSRWRSATASRRCSPATPSSPSPTPRPCCRRCSAPSCSRRPASRADLWQVVAGPGPEIGPAMIERADYICFTGSTATGKLVAKAVRRPADRLLARARRQEPDPGAPRRRPREGRRGRGPRGVLQRRPALRLDGADVRRRPGLRPVPRAVRGPHRGDDPRRHASTGATTWAR